LEPLFNSGDEHYEAAIAGKSVYHPFPGFLDNALVIRGLTKDWEPSFDFLRTLRIANPGLTGWPVWLVGESFPSPDEQPYFWHDTFEQYIYRQADRIRRRGHLDFAIFDPKGRFYLRRAFEDDMRLPEDVRKTNTSEIYIHHVVLVVRASCTTTTSAVYAILGALVGTKHHALEAVRTRREQRNQSRRDRQHLTTIPRLIAAANTFYTSETPHAQRMEHAHLTNRSSRRLLLAFGHRFPLLFVEVSETDVGGRFKTSQ
jgi:hypothetical protein